MEESSMEKQYDVIAMGELLIDFTMNGKSGQGNGLFEACPGGAPCNVLAMLGKLGKKTAFIGKVGKDQFGELLMCIQHWRLYIHLKTEIEISPFIEIRERI